MANCRLCGANLTETETQDVRLSGMCEKCSDDILYHELGRNELHVNGLVIRKFVAVPDANTKRFEGKIEPANNGSFDLEHETILSVEFKGGVIEILVG